MVLGRALVDREGTSHAMARSEPASPVPPRISTRLTSRPPARNAALPVDHQHLDRDRRPHHLAADRLRPRRHEIGQGKPGRPRTSQYLARGIGGQDLADQ